MKGISNILIIILLLLPLAVFSQGEKVADALASFQNGDLEKAKSEIDEAIVHASTASDAEAWYLRGFIYKELYKKNEKNNPESPIREDALKSFKKSIELDKDKVYEEDNINNIKYLTNTFYNDVVENLKPDRYQFSEKSFVRYKEEMLLLAQDQVLNQKEKEYKMALTHIFTQIYERDRANNEAYFEKAKGIYEDILRQDPNNISVNYNLGILYYNQAVSMINEMDYDIDIFELMEIQEKTVQIFKKSLPYMDKAYQLDPMKKETLKGLEGIYFSLNDFEKSNEFKLKLQSLD